MTAHAVKAEAENRGNRRDMMALLLKHREEDVVTKSIGLAAATRDQLSLSDLIRRYNGLLIRKDKGYNIARLYNVAKSGCHEALPEDPPVPAPPGLGS
ncbi:hypothetical protein F4801DRAFT_536286 [Xylaria longipes]|nr:hypothetical protein F4801DRAFT_536286 [Xylaria longipes]